MEEKKITTDVIADAIVNLNVNVGVCDEQTAKGFKTSKKKEILKSNKDGSFSKFQQEIIKRQTKKDFGD